MLFVLPIALFLLPLVIAPLRCNVAWWRLSMREGFEARLRTGEVERRPWSAVRRIRTSGLLVTVECADGLMLRSRRQQRSGCILDAWRERNEPGYRAPSRWGPLLALLSVMTASFAVAALLPAYRQAGSWQAIPARVFVLPLAFPFIPILPLAVLLAFRKWSERRERMHRNRLRAERRGSAASIPANPAG
jgi:hypothetical protein